LSDTLFQPAYRCAAYISPCSKYRYWLSREWGNDPASKVCFVMLNPSTADALKDDATIRRCVGFAKAWGYQGLHVVNLFALRATNPSALYSKEEADPVGPESNRFLLEIPCERIIAAWGVYGQHRGRAAEVLRMLADAGRTVECLGVTKDGYPRHPLYLPCWATPVPLIPDNARVGAGGAA